VRYCSVACQQQAWPLHRPECRQLRSAREEARAAFEAAQ